MNSLADKVRVNRRFQRSIRVDTDIDDAVALEGFTCPPSSAQALISMARQVSETGQGAFTWTGPYGSGKSSLAVALAALLGADKRRRSVAQAAVGSDAAGEIQTLLKVGRKGMDRAAGRRQERGCRETDSSSQNAAAFAGTRAM
jgi:hypothetical protein